MKKIFLTLTTLSVIFLFSSCYDSTEVDDMAYILAIGIDIGENNDNLYTFQAAVPLNISSGIETGFESSEESVTLQNFEISAPNLYSAINTANQKITKEINISHCKLILFSKEFAKHSLEAQLSAIIQNPNFRPTVLVAIADNTAQKYLNEISSPFELNPARYYDMFLGKDYSPQSFTAHLYDFEKSNTVAVPLITEDKKINTSIVQNFIQKGTLNTEETIALNMLTGNFKNGYLTVNNSLPAINLSQDSAPKIKIDTHTKNPEIYIKLSFYGTPTSLINDTQAFDKEIKNYIKNSCEALLKKSAEEFDADIVNLEKNIRLNFHTIKDFENYDWIKKYKYAKFYINVEYRTIR